MSELKYLEILRSILETGSRKSGTMSLHGVHMRFPLNNNTLPLFTHKFTSFRLITTELLWFLSGSTNVADLHVNNNHIWDANATREFLDSRGLDHPEGHLGKIYGHQWRNWNDSGIDQIQGLIDSLKTSPFSRRHILTAWNPEQLNQMALHPCHVMAQFIVKDSGVLDCVLTQRSGDFPLGVPFNVASYALLTHILAFKTGMTAGELIHNIGDAHVYDEQVDTCWQLLGKKTFPYPKLKIANNADRLEDFNLIDYQHSGVVRVPLVV